MNTFHPANILVVEDIPVNADALIAQLSEAQYNLDLAENYAEAKLFLETRNYHLGIYDIVLDANDPENKDGLRLLQDMEHLGLIGIMPCIFLSGNFTRDNLKLLMQRRHLDQFVGMVDRQDATTSQVNEIQEMVNWFFDERIRINFDIEYMPTSKRKLHECAVALHQGEKDLPPPDILFPQVLDLLGKIFYDADQLDVRRFTQGVSGSVVLEIAPNYQHGGIGKAVGVKIGRRHKIETERQNYERYITHFLLTKYRTELTEHAYARDLGALCYTFGEAEFAHTESFESYYARADASQIILSLNQLFRETFAPWRANDSKRAFADLRDLYLDAFDLKQRMERIPNVVASLDPILDLNAALWRFETPDIVLPNPLRWLQVGEATLAVRCCTTHGDLNTANILVNQEGQCWLIDFYRTGWSHVLRDFVILETDIKFRLLSALSQKQFFYFEKALLHAVHTRQGVRLGRGFSNEARKAAQVIDALRHLAFEELAALNPDSPQTPAREYFISLLMATLNVIRLRHFEQDPRLQPRRALVLLSAAMLCRVLEDEKVEFGGGGL